MTTVEEKEAKKAEKETKKAEREKRRKEHKAMKEMAFALSDDEKKKIKDDVKAGILEGNIDDAITRAEIKKAADYIEDKTQKQVNDFIQEKVYSVDISKAFMVAYIQKFGKEDKEWYLTKFKPASNTIRTRKVTTVCTAANGIAVHTIDKKTGELKPKTVRVDAVTGETYEAFDITAARKMFIEHYGIKPKEIFTPKEKKAATKYNPFDDLFK